MNCPNCNGERWTLLGALGKLWHYRCRDCGANVNASQSPEDVGAES